ncbi:MAG TPA: hypothetical protein VGF16_15155 [Bryobacteraceae bacterium]
MKVAAIVTVATLAVSAAELNGPNARFVVHEWGTFTSVAGDDGEPVPWAPLFGAPDLPCFVDRLPMVLGKWQLSGLVRMETPVLYFYTPRALTLSVHVDFPQGLITEWYPRASKAGPTSFASAGTVYRNGRIEWNDVNVLPGEKLDFPSSIGASRYYAARETDSAPLRLGDEQEKLIFYRGVGNFSPPLRPRFESDGRLEIRNAGGEPVPLAILFDSHGGRMGYRLVRGIKDSVTLDPPALTPNFDELRQDLTVALAEFGLYAKEAAAMVETWRDSWFEEGTRVLYIMPMRQVDGILPLNVNPAPDETTRVFVGRVELLSPATKQALQDAVDRWDQPALEKYGRFLSLFAKRLSLRGTTLQDAMRTLARSSVKICIQ